MKPGTRFTISIALVISMTLPAWSQNYYLYTPQPVDPSQKQQVQHEGILVQEMEIQKGDTLYKISRKFNGRGMYFPQILLFNKIKNPDLIYPGTLLKIPVTQKQSGDTVKPEVRKKSTARVVPRQTAKTQEASPVQLSQPPTPSSTSNTELSLSDLKKSGTSKSVARQSRKQTAGHATKKPMQQQPAVEAVASLPPAGETIAGQKLFESAVKAYKRDDCRTALELLDRYLAVNSGSPLAADASLYKADCYLKLSAQ